MPRSVCYRKVGGKYYSPSQYKKLKSKKSKSKSVRRTRTRRRRSYRRQSYRDWVDNIAREEAEEEYAYMKKHGKKKRRYDTEESHAASDY